MSEKNIQFIFISKMVNDSRFALMSIQYNTTVLLGCERNCFCWRGVMFNFWHYLCVPIQYEIDIEDQILAFDIWKSEKNSIFEKFSTLPSSPSSLSHNPHSNKSISNLYFYINKMKLGYGWWRVRDGSRKKFYLPTRWICQDTRT